MCACFFDFAISGFHVCVCGGGLGAGELRGRGVRRIQLVLFSFHPNCCEHSCVHPQTCLKGIHCLFCLLRFMSLCDTVKSQLCASL